MITLALVDDDPMVRTGLSYILAANDDVTIAWQASDGAQALANLATAPVDVMLLDIRMPGMDGLATLEALRAMPNAPRVIVLTTFNTDDYVVRALRAGAAGFLLKDAAPAALVDGIRQVAAGEPSLSPAVTHTLIDVATQAGAGDPSAKRLVASLTERERDAATLLAQGLTNAQIATRLNLSMASVKTHLASVFLKFGVDNRVSAAMVMRDGL